MRPPRKPGISRIPDPIVPVGTGPHPCLSIIAPEPDILRPVVDGPKPTPELIIPDPWPVLIIVPTEPVQILAVISAIERTGEGQRSTAVCREFMGNSFEDMTARCT